MIENNKCLDEKLNLHQPKYIIAPPIIVIAKIAAKMDNIIIKTRIFQAILFGFKATRLCKHNLINSFK